MCIGVVLLLRSVLGILIGLHPVIVALSEDAGSLVLKCWILIFMKILQMLMQTISISEGTAIETGEVAFFVVRG